MTLLLNRLFPGHHQDEVRRDRGQLRPQHPEHDPGLRRQDQPAPGRRQDLVLREDRELLHHGNRNQLHQVEISLGNSFN